MHEVDPPSDGSDKLIYESPDGGKTVYARPFGENLEYRKKVYESPESIAKRAIHDRWHMYRDILDASKDNPVLQKLLEQVEILYKLS